MKDCIARATLILDKTRQQFIAKAKNSPKLSVYTAEEIIRWLNDAFANAEQAMQFEAELEMGHDNWGLHDP